MQVKSRGDTNFRSNHHPTNYFYAIDQSSKPLLYPPTGCYHFVLISCAKNNSLGARGQNPESPQSLFCKFGPVSQCEKSQKSLQIFNGNYLKSLLVINYLIIDLYNFLLISETYLTLLAPGGGGGGRRCFPPPAQ